MAAGFRLTRHAAAWAAVALVLAVPALVNGVGASRAVDWQPQLAFSEPWRWWSAAWVHLSQKHLTLNLAGTALVAALGLAAPAGPRAACAWLMAWPLTHLGLLLRPELAHYGGLSGVLHAGAAVIAVDLARRAEPGQRWLGIAIGSALLAKVLSESPWGPVLRHPSGWDIALAPLSHACGALSGSLCALLLVTKGARH